MPAYLDKIGFTIAWLVTLRYRRYTPEKFVMRAHTKRELREHIVATWPTGYEVLEIRRREPK